MRVAVDARTIYAPTRRGTAKNLIDLYSLIAGGQPDWEIVMFHQLDAENPFEAFRNVRPVRIDIRGDRFNLWQDMRLPAAARLANADVLHCPANTAPYEPLTPMVVTIHDMIPLEVAPAAPSTRRWLRRVRRSARRARHIITPSYYSRDAIVDALEIPGEKVTVNYWAADRKCRRIDDERVLQTTRRSYGLPGSGPYVLAFGADDPRKNTGTLLDAWRRLPPDVPADASLLIVGLQPSALARFRPLAEGCGRACVLHGFADEDDIPALMSGARALCYPSLSEGFGLPVVDAFACQTPVITSRTTSLAEIAGEHALLVDPTDADAIASAMADVLTSDALANRLGQSGRERLAAFSWERCARTAAAVLKAAAGGAEATR